MLCTFISLVWMLLNNPRNHSERGLEPRTRKYNSYFPMALKQTPKSLFVAFSNDGIPQSGIFVTWTQAAAYNDAYASLHSLTLRDMYIAMAPVLFRVTAARITRFEGQLRRKSD